MAIFYKKDSIYGSNRKRNYLQKGDSGDEVKQLQQNLIIWDITAGSAGADGIFGDSTEKAVKTFQKNQNLTEDGLAGEKTQNQIKNLLRQKAAAKCTSRREPTEQKKMQT